MFQQCFAAGRGCYVVRGGGVSGNKAKKRKKNCACALSVRNRSGFPSANMEVFVVAPNLRFSCWTFPVQSSIQDIVDRFGEQQVSIYAGGVHTWQKGCSSGTDELAELAIKQKLAGVTTVQPVVD